MLGAGRYFVSNNCEARAFRIPEAQSTLAAQAPKVPPLVYNYSGQLGLRPDTMEGRENAL